MIAEKFAFFQAISISLFFSFPLHSFHVSILQILVRSIVHHYDSYEVKIKL